MEYLDPVVYILCGVLVLYQAWRWYATWRCCGSRVLPLAGQMVLMSSRGWKVLHFLAALAAVGVGVALAFLGYPLSLMVLAVTVGVWYVLFVILPPVVLLLTSSNPAAVELMHKISAMILPLRVTALLDPHKAEGPAQHMALVEGNLRTRADSVWRDTVDRLTNIVSWIVLDMRVMSPAVREEFELICQRNLAPKTLFYVGSSGREGLLQMRGLSLPLILHTDEDVARQLRDKTGKGPFHRPNHSGSSTAAASPPEPMAGRGVLSGSAICDLIAKKLAQFKGGRGMVLVLQEGRRVRLFFFNGVPRVSWSYANENLKLDRVGQTLLESPPISLALEEGEIASLATTVRSRFSQSETSVNPLWQLDPKAWDYQAMRALHEHDIGIRISFQ